MNNEHIEQLEVIQRALKAQANGTIFDVQSWLIENASVEQASTVSLSARIESRKQSSVSSSEKFMYASVAIASIVAVYINVQQMRNKNRVEVADVYERLV